jgi:hypothetical protein
LVSVQRQSGVRILRDFELLGEGAIMRKDDVDVFTYNFGYVGTRTTGSAGDAF